MTVRKSDEHRVHRGGLRTAKKLTASLLAAVLLLSNAALFAGAEEAAPDAAQEGTSSSQSNASETAYVTYLEKYKNVPDATTSFTVNAAGEGVFTLNGMENAGVLKKGDEGTADIFTGDKQAALLTDEQGYAEWKFTVPETGMYNIAVTYLGYNSKGGSIERRLTIDGKVPFDEAEYISLGRVFEDVFTLDDNGNRKTDVNGNDIRPKQNEVLRWIDADLRDTAGYFADPLSFYLEKGEHTLRFDSERESVLIEKFVFYRAESAPSYAEVKAEYERRGYQAAAGEVKFLQAEDLFEKSDKSNYPVNDRTSAATMPQDIYCIKLNSLGGQKWAGAGSWVTWQVTVPETGLYKIAPRSRQNIYSGVYVSRKLTIDGKLPFAEAGNLTFDYSTTWECKPLGNGEEDFLFYFEAGKTYELGMEVVLGDMGDVLRRVTDIVDNLNADYRKILMITGSSPDKYRDYSFRKTIPDVLDDMAQQAQELNAVGALLEKLTGEKGERVVQLNKLEYLIDRMVKDTSEIAGKFSMFKDNIAALGTWVLETASQPLELDYIAFVPANAEPPKANAGFFTNLAFSFESFLSSFMIDYQSIGTTIQEEETSKSITVWLTSGRDQSSIVRELIDSTFTPNYNVGVNLQLVAGGTMLPSVLAGRGPDVAIGMAMGDPINYAVRGAVLGLSDNEGFNEITKRFHESALVPYQFNGETYALPETQSFNMLFYRTDIFAELGLEAPETWEDLEILIPELQKKNMSIGLPHDLNALLMFMYQNDAPLYLENGKYANLDSKEAVQAFTRLTDYFSLYKFPTEYDFANRFRSGEMPIALADYTMYNQLTLFAPEIRGQWAMTSVPGTPVTDEEGKPVLDAEGKQVVNHATPSAGASVMMLRGCTDTESAWKFMEWWTSADVQASFGTEMETVMSNAARQPTANLEALSKMSWSVKDYNSISSQWTNVRGTPEVPGSYYTGRIVTFAFNRVVNEGVDAGDALQNYIESLNAELARKRKEFGLD